MNALTLLAATAAVAGLAAPASAQYYPQQSYPQQGYGYPQQAYPQQGYAYPQQQGGIAGIINQLLGGNRYSGADRQAVTQCAAAAQAQVMAQYQPRGAYGAYGQQQPYGGGWGQQQAYGGYGQYGQQPYGGAYGQQQAYGGMGAPRVTGITNVERRQNGLRLSGLISTGMIGNQRTYGGAYGQQQPYGAYGQQPYGGAYGQSDPFANPAFAAQASDLMFRCTVDYRGAVTSLSVRRNPNFRPY